MLPISGSIDITAKRYVPKDYPTSFDTIYEHLRAKCLNLHLSSVAVANMLNVTAITIREWEKGLKTPTPKSYESIIKWLSYIPRIKKHNTNTLAGKLYMYRMQNGIIQNDIAKALHIDRWAVSEIEQGKEVLPRYIDAVEKLLECNFTNNL